MMVKQLPVLFGILLLAFTGLGQSKLEKKGMQLIEQEKFVEAVDQLKKAFEKETEAPARARISHYIAESYLNQVAVPPPSWNFKSSWYAETVQLAEKAHMYYHKASMMQKNGPLYHWQIKMAEFYERMGMSKDARDSYQAYFNSDKKYQKEEFSKIATEGLARTQKTWGEESKTYKMPTFGLKVSVVQGQDTSVSISNARIRIVDGEGAVVVEGKTNNLGEWMDQALPASSGQTFVIKVEAENHVSGEGSITFGTVSAMYLQEFRLARKD